MKNAKSVSIKFISAFIALIITVSSLAALTGCSFFNGSNDYIEFTKSKLELTVGDEYDLSGIIRGSTGNYTLTSSRSEIVSVSGTTATANKSGSATVTAATSKGSKTSINVIVADEDGFSVEADGDLIQTLGKTSRVMFTPYATGSIASQDIDWYVNGKLTDSLAASVSFSFTPSEAGEFTIRGEAGSSEFFAEYIVRAYYAVDATGSVSGELEQDEPYSALTFSVDVDRNSLNPADYIDWRINGESVYAGTDTEVSFKPSTGYHTVTLFVNGEPREIDGEPSVTVLFKGSVVPDKPELIYDNVYPFVYVAGDVVGDTQVEITSPDGTVVEYSENDPRYTILFGNNYGFNAKDIVDVCATTATAGKYKFRIKSLGDGRVYTESDYSDYTEFTQLPSAAKTYLQDRQLDFDAYITSPEEYAELLEYHIIFRKKAANTMVTFKCYIDFPITGNADDFAEELFENSFHWAATSGSYTGIGISLTNKVMRTSFKIDTVNNPSKETYSTINAMIGSYSDQLHALMPHINYDPDKYRPDDYKFPIDKIGVVKAVTYSDELYLAAEHNTRPYPAIGSAAATIYELARSVLRQIVTDDMTDAEKAHAIYDWIMWQVTYDTEAAAIDENGEAYSAYYLEGVFGDGKTPIAGKVYHPYAVCDGMSKAYSLMCNIEGIPCVRVSGMAGESMDDSGGHAWNKVYIDGAWYIVDCTWGDGNGELDLEGDRRVKSYELALHDWLFVTDAQADATHYEPYEFGESNLICAPETAKQKYNVYKDMTYYGVDINCSIAANEDEKTRVEEICTAFASAYSPRSTVYIPGYQNGVYSVDYEAVEIYFEAGISSSSEVIKSAVERSVKAVRPSAQVKVFAYDTLLLVMIKG